MQSDKYLNSFLAPKKNRRALQQTWPIMLMTYPFFVLVLLFAYAPLWGWSIAFVDYSPGVGIFESAFAGLKYFGRLFRYGSDFLVVLRNTMVLSLLGLAIAPAPMLLAVMLNEVKFSGYKRLIQTITSFPNFISWIIVYSIFFGFLSVDDGMLNQLLLRMGVLKEPLNLLSDPKYTWMFMTFATLWKTAGWDAIIYLSAISGIDQELYQAAEVDGAGRFRCIWHVTLPGILPTFSVLLVLTAGNLLNLGFDQYFVFHNSLVHEVIEVLDTYTYRIGIMKMDFSYATAVGIFKTGVSIVVLFLANHVHKKIRGYSIL